MSRVAKGIVAAVALALAVGASVDGGAATHAAQQGAARPVSAGDFGRQSFDRSTVVDNAWFPLRPGTQLTFRGATSEGKRRVPHKVVFTVTDLTKTIRGIRTVVIWELDYSDGELVEAELAFFAQDDDGNVWHLGQYPEEYENGKIVATPAWLVGFERARAGIAMKAEPKLGAPAYSQGFAPPPINWTDHARVHRIGISNCVPVGCYDNVLVTDEFNPDEPGRHQLKYYARGLGNIRVGWMGARETDKETLVLVKAVRLAPSALAKARASALAQEARAYRLSENVVGRTPRSTRLPA